MRTFADSLGSKPLQANSDCRIRYGMLRVPGIFSNGHYPAAHLLSKQTELVREQFGLDWYEVNCMRAKSNATPRLPITSLQDFAPASRPRRYDRIAGPSDATADYVESVFGST